MKITHAVFIFVSFFCFAQKQKPENYHRFDEHLIHFGFMLGGNSATFLGYPAANNFQNFNLKSLNVIPQPGGQVGIVSTLKLSHPVMRLRFLPSLSFQERAIQYYYQNPDPTKKDIFNEERVNSTNLDFPLMLQFRTTRLNNFAAYALCGGQYTLDLQSQEDASQNYIDPYVKIRKNDYFAQVGGGIEFFSPYFKFGIELKLSQSFRNSLIQDLTPVSKPLDALYNRVWYLSLIFEG